MTRALLVLLALAACGGRDGTVATTSPATTPPEAIAVTVVPAAVRPIERVVSVVGTLAAAEETDLASETEGQVIAIEADLGDRVHAGQVLARVRSDVLEAQLREAEAAFEKASADETRAEPLRASGVIAVQEYERVRTEREVTRARRDRLRIEVERAAIRAPFAGSVSARLASVGDYVRPGAPVFRLVQDDPLKFRAEVPERDVPALRVGQTLRVAVDAYPGETFLGTIARVGAAADPVARSLAFEGEVPNADHRLRPGFFGRGEVLVERNARGLAVPRSAVSTFAGVTKIFVVDEGVAHEQPVMLGTDLGDGWVEVVSGLARGVAVATSGLSRLSDGARVTVKADAPPDA
ncbi:MAG TPA: efflux RND transporter periplasmic adaptor subunit [Candidatus Limnocylindria bacterium]|nr:efflux RND transporter periplasmic adaptor subunit [Candidatus Limnocylindria bacterium]